MSKIDFKKELKSLYSAETQPQNVIVPELQYLMIDGKGDPNTSKEFQGAVEALFSVSYAMKFMVKKSQGLDYGVMPLEGLWWTEKMGEFTTLDKSNWLWTVMIMQPDFIDSDIFESAKQKTIEKKKNPQIHQLRLEKFKEGKSAQILHIGPFANETENIQKLHKFIKDQGKTFDGLVQKHHEIYISDMRKTAPEKLKTIIRQSYV